jgi:peptidoglycan LD-endopeptidase LytH
MRWVAVAGAVALAATSAWAERGLVWPTPNRAYLEGKGFEAFVQPTVSGLVESGLFGCVRSGGSQFHEGLDLFPLQRDRRGEPLDPVFAILPGVVRYVNARVGDSSYGRYVVIEHPGTTPAVVSLYAHLRSIAPDLAPGSLVKAGDTIGGLGRSAGGYSIPTDRAHLHLEIGLWATRDFQSWYNSRGFGSPNKHGLWHGFNILGFDALDYWDRWQAGQVTTFRDYLIRQPTALSVRVRATKPPDFAQRYPSLLTGPLPARVAGWQVDFTWFGIPKAWTPLEEADFGGRAAARPEIVFHDAELLARYPCHGLTRGSGARLAPGPKLEEALSLLFGVK